jgi:hypothetical protein
MHDADIANSNAHPDKVDINLNVLGVLVLYGVGGHVDGADVVAVNQRSTLWWCVELKEKLSQPGGLCNAIGHGTILSFCAGPRDCVLTLQRPGDQVIAKEHRITRGGFASVWTTVPISI